MCSYKKLYQNKEGYVIRCAACMNIQVAFGTTGFTFTPAQFDDFLGSISRLYDAHKYFEFPDRKKVIVPTLCRSVTMLCTVNELAKLKQLLVEGKNSIELAKLFVFNEN